MVNQKTKVAVVGGDGIGPEVIKEGLKVLDAVGLSLDLEHFDLEVDI